MKVYVIIENWDNLDVYEDHDHIETIIGIASTKERALDRINNRISHIKKMVEYKDKASFKYEIERDQKQYLTISHYNYDIDGEYTWEIESYEIDNFDLVDKELYI